MAWQGAHCPKREKSIKSQSLATISNFDIITNKDGMNGAETTRLLEALLNLHDDYGELMVLVMKISLWQQLHEIPKAGKRLSCMSKSPYVNPHITGTKKVTVKK